MSIREKLPALTAKNVAVYGLAIAIPAFGGVAFIYKMSEFAMTIVNSDISGFGATAVATYLTGMLPLLMLSTGDANTVIVATAVLVDTQPAVLLPVTE